MSTSTGSSPERIARANDSKNTVRRVFFLDVNPLCYRGSTPSLQAFAVWLSKFFSQVSLTDPVIAVSDSIFFGLFLLVGIVSFGLK